MKFLAFHNSSIGDVAAGIPLPPESPPNPPAVVPWGLPEGWLEFAARPPVQELMSEGPDPFTLEEAWEAWDTMFDNDQDRPSPKKERIRRVYDKFIAVKHQYEMHVDEDVFAVSDQMNGPA